MLNRRMLVAGLLVLLVSGCATGRRVGVVSVITAGATLLAIDEAERAMRCGQPSAQEPPACVSPEAHRQISARMEHASTLAADAVRMVRATPSGPQSLQPADVVRMLASVGALIRDVLGMLPRSPQKASLVQRLEVAQ